jgi:hypothetical protein
MRAKCTENFRYFIINKRATNSWEVYWVFPPFYN